FFLLFLLFSSLLIMHSAFIALLLISAALACAPSSPSSSSSSGGNMPAEKCTKLTLAENTDCQTPATGCMKVNTVSDEKGVKCMGGSTKIQLTDAAKTKTTEYTSVTCKGTTFVGVKKGETAETPVPADSLASCN
ncbi:hypothetical protein PFISCL1PPCAC_3442, partial [Pristionchus fissidentatus]